MPSQTFSLSEDDVKTVEFVKNNLTSNVSSLVLDGETIWSKKAKIRAPLFDTETVGVGSMSGNVSYPYGRTGFCITSSHGADTMANINYYQNAFQPISIVTNGGGFQVNDYCMAEFPETYTYNGTDYTIHQYDTDYGQSISAPHSGFDLVCTGVNSTGGATSFRVLKYKNTQFLSYIATRVGFVASNGNRLNSAGTPNSWSYPISIDLRVRVVLSPWSGNSNHSRW